MKGFGQCTLLVSSLSIYPSAHNQLSERFSGNPLYIGQDVKFKGETKNLHTKYNIKQKLTILATPAPSHPFLIRPC